MSAGNFVYVVAARRTVLGRVGGLHRRRRVEDLGGPVVRAALDDAGISSDRVADVIMGNTAEGGNPARLIALSAGLPDTVPGITVDRQEASGLEALVQAQRMIRCGDADIVVAGGAESLSTAPWRVIRPRSLYQTPRFEGLGQHSDQSSALPVWALAGQALASQLRLSREVLDAYALRSHIKAFLGQEAKRYLGEILPLKVLAEEARDESLDGDLTGDDLAALVPFTDADTALESNPVTPGNVSIPHDGAAAVVLVSEAVWRELGQPAGLKLLASHTLAVESAVSGLASIRSVEALFHRAKRDKFSRAGLMDLKLFEIAEGSAAEAIAFRDALRLEDGAINPDGGAIARGNPIGATGIVLVNRLFSRMVRQRKGDSPRLGLASQSATGGIGTSVLFETV